MRIILLGPTASGKTALSILLAEKFGTSIISADSRQCFKYLDIGTAKPSPEDLKRVPHFNISLLDPDKEDSAMKFRRRAEHWEQEILKKNEHVIYVGGSTLYLQGLIQPFNEMPDANSENIRQLEARADKEGLQSLFAILKEVDPEYAKKMDGMNRQRIIRALDVWMQTGETFSSFHQQGNLQPDENTVVIGLDLPREKLYDRINKRTDLMLKEGLIDETKSILKKGYSPDLQSLNTVGYKEIIAFLNGDMSLDTAIQKIKINTRRYAKRQLTWFRRWDFIHWLKAEGRSEEELREEAVGIINAEL